MLRTALLVCTILVTVGACSPPPESVDPTTDQAAVNEEVENTSEPIESETVLLGTRWTLVEIDGQPAATYEGQDEPHLVLEEVDGEPRMHGSGGCNNMTGSYTLDGAQLSFGPIAATRKMCPQGMDLEHAFGQALAIVERFEVDGPALTLFATDGTTLLLQAGP